MSALDDERALRRAATRDLVNAAIRCRRYLGELADLLRPEGNVEAMATLARDLDSLDAAIADAQGQL